MPDTLDLYVETPNGVYLRRVQPAIMLPIERRSGHAIEGATRIAAAFWGLPDFVFRPALRSRGSANREIGDGILIVGERGVVLQVKARQAASSESTRERLWLGKSIDKACRQANGTIRSLTSTDQVALVNERGREVMVSAKKKSWLPVVVLDHPGVEDFVPEGDVVILLRRDWEFLFQQLKSTYAVVDYLWRVSGAKAIALGDEPIRYYRLAAADLATDPSPMDPRLSPYMSTLGSTPLLPQTPAGHDEDRYHFLVRAVLEDIATGSVPVDSDIDVLNVLGAIDATPVAYRAELGKMWMSWLAEVAESRDSVVTWRFRGHIWTDRPYLIFGAGPRHNATVQTAFGTYVRLRHLQHLEVMPERLRLLTVGVLLTPRTDGKRPWDTTMIATYGDEPLRVDERAQLEHIWGRLGQGVNHLDTADLSR